MAHRHRTAQYTRPLPKSPSLKPLTLKDADAVVLAVRHAAYLELELNPDMVLEMTGRPVAVNDCFGILTDEQIRIYFENSCHASIHQRSHYLPG